MNKQQLEKALEDAYTFGKDEEYYRQQNDWYMVELCRKKFKCLIDQMSLLYELHEVSQKGD